MDKVGTGAKVLDSLLDGGLERGIITTLFGSAGSGKSNIAMLSALSVAERVKKVVFIDTEKSLSAERIKQLRPQGYKQIIKKGQKPWQLCPNPDCRVEIMPAPAKTLTKTN